MDVILYESIKSLYYSILTIMAVVNVSVTHGPKEVTATTATLIVSCTKHLLSSQIDDITVIIANSEYHVQCYEESSSSKIVCQSLSKNTKYNITFEVMDHICPVRSFQTSASCEYINQ